MENEIKTLERLKAEVDRRMVDSPFCKQSDKWVFKSLDSFSFSTIGYYNVDTESDYLNIHIYSYDIPKERGYVRLYRGAHGLKTQIWRPTTMQYSGIPTFPSARCR